MKKRNKLIIDCECGCGAALSFTFQHNLIYINVLESYFYAEQRSLRNIISDKIRLLGNDRWITSVGMRKADVLRIIQFLESHECSTESAYNDSYIRLSYEKMRDKNASPVWYDMTVYCTMPRRQILFGKNYRAGEIVVNEMLKRKILNHLQTVLKKASAEGTK